MRRIAPLIITLVLEAAAVASLHFLGGIAAPVRLALLLVAWWLLAGTLFRVIAHLTGAPRALRASARVTPPPLRYRVDRALVASLVAGSMFVAATPAGATDAPADPPVDTAAVEVPAGGPPVVDAPPTDPPPVDTPAVDPPTTPDPAPPVEVRTGMAADPAAVTAPVADVPEVDAAVTVRTPAPAPPPTRDSRSATPFAPAVAPEPTRERARNDVSLPAVGENLALPVTPASGSYTVVAGDSLWDIAARHLAESTGRAVDQLTNAEVVTYWVRVCEANRARLRSGDPNLIYAGEVIDLPGV